MKTADLIPLILLELAECDKYGFELTKAIETKSNGNIIIKQPTLYTVLKKLEKSKFISSYWQDSEIGGKRHYYKITEFGRMQVSTLPSYESLIANILTKDEEATADITPQENPIELKESVVPTAEVFASNSIDTNTDAEINISNSEILKDEKTKKDLEFATNKDVSKFTEKRNISPVQPVELPTEKFDIFTEYNATTSINKQEIKYVDYVNFKTEPNYKYSKTLSKKMLWKTFFTSAVMLLTLLICGLFTAFSGTSALFYIFLISGVVFAIFYPAIFLFNIDKFRLKYQEKTYIVKRKKALFINGLILLVVFIICLAFNIMSGNNTFALIFRIENFENLYAPMAITFSLLSDIVYEHFFIAKIKK